MHLKEEDEEEEEEEGEEVWTGEDENINWISQIFDYSTYASKSC